MQPHFKCIYSHPIFSSADIISKCIYQCVCLYVECVYDTFYLYCTPMNSKYPHNILYCKVYFVNDTYVSN